jgi:hypothetical protein
MTDRYHVIVGFVFISFVYSFILWRNSPTRRKAAAFLRFLDLTRARAVELFWTNDSFSHRLVPTQHTERNRKISIPLAGFEPAVAAVCVYPCVYSAMVMVGKKREWGNGSKGLLQHVTNRNRKTGHCNSARPRKLVQVGDVMRTPTCVNFKRYLQWKCDTSEDVSPYEDRNEFRGPAVCNRSWSSSVLLKILW